MTPQEAAACARLAAKVHDDTQAGRRPCDEVILSLCRQAVAVAKEVDRLQWVPMLDNPPDDVDVSGH